MEWLCLIDNKRKEHADKVEMNNMRKCLFVVDLVGLSEVVSNQASFMTSNGAIWVILKYKHLLICHDIDISHVWDQLPSPLSF